LTEALQALHDLHLRATVRTDPPGALVRLGDHAEKSPAAFDELEPRKYKLRIMSPGYEPIETIVDLVGKKISGFAGVLFKAKQSRARNSIRARGCKVLVALKMVTFPTTELRPPRCLLTVD
jgi:hypothetical protein